MCVILGTQYYGIVVLWSLTPTTTPHPFLFVSNVILSYPKMANLVNVTAFRASEAAAGMDS